MSLDILKKEAINSTTSPQRLKEIAAINDELARLVATNPLADSKLLEELCLQARKTRNLEIQKAIASNPNTPKTLLIELAHIFPEEFFDNPIYDLSIITENSTFGYLNHPKLPLRLVYASNLPESFINFTIKISTNHLKSIKQEQYFKTYSLEEQAEIYTKYHEYDRDVIYCPFTHYPRRYWEWREVLFLIAINYKTSFWSLRELSKHDDLIISEISKISLKHYHKNSLQDYNIYFWNKVALYNKINLIQFTPYKLIYKLVQLPNISTNFLDAVSELKGATRILHVVANQRNSSNKTLNKLVKNKEPLIAESAKLHISYRDEIVGEHKELAQSKINRNLSRPLKSDEAIELRLWRAGIISKDALIYLGNKFSEEYISTLLYIICFKDTPKYILSYLENNHIISQLVKDCISYLKQEENLIINRLPKSFPINIDIFQRANRYRHLLTDPVADLEILFEKLKDLNWQKKPKIIVLVEKPSFAMCLIKRVQMEIETNEIKYYYAQNMLRAWDREIYTRGLLYKLCNVEYYGFILANYPETSGDILAELVKHPIKEVRTLVASHQNVTQDSLKELINDRDLEVKEAALANPKINLKLKQELISLENSNLSSAELQELANSKYTIVREKVTQHPNINEDTLSKLSNDKLQVKIAVAKNSKTPVNILVKFANHPEKELRLAVAKNSNTPLESLIRLATKRTKSNGYPFTSIELAALKTLLEQYPDEAIPILDKCLKYPDRPSYARFLVLLNPNISSKFLARYYQSWFWIERYAIANNTNTDRAILQQLFQDCNCLVRAAAQSNLIMNY